MQVFGVKKQEREGIFKLFLRNSKLKFHEIEDKTTLRSNHLAYHLARMQKEGLIEKRDENYRLTKNAERYLPIFPHTITQSMSPVPIVLICVTNKDKILMIKRNNRPYKGYWSLIGGKMLLEENFAETARRLVKEKSGLDITNESMNAVLQERVQEEGTIKHNFILFLMKAKTKQSKIIESHYGELKWLSIKDIEKENIIPSDYWLIKNKLNSKTSVKSAVMTDEEGTLSSFHILK